MKKIIYFFLKLRAIRIVRKNSVINGTGQVFLSSSRATIKGGSIKEDIVIGHNVWMYGTLVSVAGGKITMDEYSKIGVNSKILCVNKVTIGSYTAIAENVVISDNNNHPVSPQYRLAMRVTPQNSEMRSNKYSENAPIIIGSNVWIGRNVSINKGVTIGDNAIIAANSVVVKDVPANSIAAGNPAKIVKTDIDKIPMPELAYKTFFENK